MQQSNTQLFLYICISRHLLNLSWASLLPQYILNNLDWHLLEPPFRPQIPNTAIMTDYLQFDRVFGSVSQFPYNRTVAVSIETSRRSLEGSLFIDRVLKALNLGQGKHSFK